MMKQALIYSLKVWLTSIVVGSILTSLPFIIESAGWYELVTTMFGGVLLMMIVAALLSILCWVALLLSTYILMRQPYNIQLIKLRLSVIGLILALVPLLLFTGGGFGVDWTNRLALICFPALIVAGI